MVSPIDNAVWFVGSTYEISWTGNIGEAVTFAAVSDSGNRVAIAGPLVIEPDGNDIFHFEYTIPENWSLLGSDLKIELSGNAATASSATFEISEDIVDAFRLIEGKYLNRNNEKVLALVSFEDCAQACYDHLWCLSFEVSMTSD